MTELSITAAFLLGLLGSAHCIGMCGSIMSALSISLPPSKRVPKKLLPLLASYNLGRMASYGCMGALLGLIGTGLYQLPTTAMALRIMAALLLIVMGCYLAGWWQGLTRLEQLGSYLWRYLKPFASRLLPVRHAGHALLLGALWGWLPCGLVYSTLIWAASSGNWQQASLLMVSFGLGTIPAMFVTGLAAEQFRVLVQSQRTRHIAGVLVILFGLWSIPGPHQHWLSQQLTIDTSHQH